MTQLIMLGTGCGDVENFYNTCFVIQNKNGNFLVDNSEDKVNINGTEYKFFDINARGKNNLDLNVLWKGND